jgi:hypothetical protein
MRVSGLKIDFVSSFVTRENNVPGNCPGRFFSNLHDTMILIAA